ncbi:MAG TPA: hypothetical protein VNF68_10015, partial [Candidatus Baltobacteraceae bacterium]|nr:hypothetical protein [Candidatus Baltobacteraceae bacterium]
MFARRALALVGFALLLSSCGGGGSVPAGPRVGSNPLASATLPVSITVPVPASAPAKRHPAFVSPATQSLAVFVYPTGTTQPTTPSGTVTISPTAPGCALNASGTSITCTLNVTAPIGTVEVTLEAMSGPNGTGSVLSQATQSVTVSAGMAAVTFTLNGALAQIRLSLETPVFAAGTAGTSILDVNAYDASGNEIVAPGNFAVPVNVASDSTSVTLSATSAAAPGTKITISYAGGTAPYAVHLSGTGGGVAANLLVGSTLYIAPSQSMVVFGGYGQGTGNNVATFATNATTLEPPQSLIQLSSASTYPPQNGG